MHVPQFREADEKGEFHVAQGLLRQRCRQSPSRRKSLLACRLGLFRVLNCSNRAQYGIETYFLYGAAFQIRDL